MEKYKIEFHSLYSGRQVLIYNFEQPKLVQFYPCEISRIEANSNFPLQYEEIKELENDNNLTKAISIKSFEEIIPVLDSYSDKIKSLDDGFTKIKRQLTTRYEQIITRLVDGSDLD